MRSRVLWLTLAGCTAPVAGPSPSTSVEAPIVSASTPPNPAALTRPKRPILVGGCLTRCTSPLESATAFARHSANGDGAGLVAHLDTAELVAFGESLGETWARDGEKDAARRAGIEAFVSRWLAESHATDGATAEPQLSRGADAEKATALWSAPSGHRYRLTLGRRGLEWLVRGIERVAE